MIIIPVLLNKKQIHEFHAKMHVHALHRAEQTELLFFFSIEKTTSAT